MLKFPSQALKVYITCSMLTCNSEGEKEMNSVFPKLTQSTSTHFEIITFLFSLLFMESFLTIFFILNS